MNETLSFAGWRPGNPDQIIPWKDRYIIKAMDLQAFGSDQKTICFRLYMCPLHKSKDSPADAPNKIYNFLFKWRIPYDESKHREYLKSLKK